MVLSVVIFEAVGRCGPQVRSVNVREDTAHAHGDQTVLCDAGSKERLHPLVYLSKISSRVFLQGFFRSRSVSSTEIAET